MLPRWGAKICYSRSGNVHLPLGLQFALVAICVSSLYLNTHNTILSPSHVSALQYSAALVAPVDPTNTPSTWQHPRVHSLGASTPCPVVNCHAGLRKWNPAICSYSNSRVKKKLKRGKKRKRKETKTRNVRGKAQGNDRHWKLSVGSFLLS